MQVRKARIAIEQRYQRAADRLEYSLRRRLTEIRKLEAKESMDRIKDMSLEEIELQSRVDDLDDQLFGDLLFEELLEEDQDNEFRLMQPLDELPMDNTIFAINPDIDVHGGYDPLLNIVEIHPEHMDDITIVHEILHVYETYFEKRHSLRDFWITRLYSRLTEKIPKSVLDGYCCQLGLLRAQMFYASDYGDHSIFFLLKSIDIDMRLGFPVGTVFGYEGVLTF